MKSKLFIAALALAVCTFSAPAISSTIADTPVLNASSVPCNSDLTCSFIANIRVQNVTFASVLGSGLYGWASGCPSSPDGVIYIRPTGATLGCFAMQGFASAATPGVPTGAAGGDLSNTYPNPRVIKINGQTPAAVATSGLYSDIIGTPSALPPNGSAGGDLSSTYPNPVVSKVHGVVYGANPATNTVAVVTSSNTTTYEPVPIAALAVDPTNASNLSSGTVSNARGGAGATNGIMKANGSGVVNGSGAGCADLADDGTACKAATGASGHTLGYLDGNNTSTGANVHDTVGSDTFNGTTSFPGPILQAQNLLWHRDNPAPGAPPASFAATCGDEISSEGNANFPLRVVLPSPTAVAPAPLLLADCTIALYASNSANPILIDPNGSYIKTSPFDRVASQFTLPGSEGHAGFVLRYAGNGIEWQFSDAMPPPSSIFRYNLHHGAVRFDHDAANSRSRLCPHGDGGLIIDRRLFYVPSTCVLLPDGVVGNASTFYYIYALMEDQLPIAATTAGGGGSPCPDATKMCLQFTNTSDVALFASGSPMTCVNFGLHATGTPLANVIDDKNTILVNVGGPSGTSYVELSDIVFNATEASASYSGQTPPQCMAVVLKPDGAPVLDPLMDIMVETSRPFETLVGAIYVDASGNVVDTPCERNVASYYTRMPKQFQCVLATSSSTTATTYRTPNTTPSFQGQFITFGQPNSGGNPSVPWSASMRAQTPSTTSPTGGLAVIFDHSSRNGNSVCTTGATLEAPDKQVVAMTTSKDTDFQTEGVTTAPLEGFENYMHLCSFISATPSTNTLNVEALDEVGLVGPGATTITATLSQ